MPTLGPDVFFLVKLFSSFDDGLEKCFSRHVATTTHGAVLGPFRQLEDKETEGEGQRENGRQVDRGTASCSRSIFDVGRGTQ